MERQAAPCYDGAVKPKLRDLEFEPNKAFERLKHFAKAIIAVPKKDVIKAKEAAPSEENAADGNNTRSANRT